MLELFNVEYYNRILGRLLGCLLFTVFVKGSKDLKVVGDYSQKSAWCVPCVRSKLITIPKITMKACYEHALDLVRGLPGGSDAV